ncbi:MAG: putative O-antigen export system permease protein [Hyphomicrobiales bacterium]|nr:putative O-antigen export system permease protein [Hyphomicrobiales bacterium]
MLDRTSLSRRLRVLHAYKVYHPESYGGVPYVLQHLLRVAPTSLDHKLIVCSQSCGDEPQVMRVRSFGNLFSLPIAPAYPFRLWRALDDADVAVLHAPFPLADLVLGLGLRRRVRLIVYWHSDIVKQRVFRRLLAPLTRRVLQRAERIIVSHPSVVQKGSLLESFANKCAAIPFAVDAAALDAATTPEQVGAIRARLPQLIVACGRLVAYKGFDVLVEAARHIPAPVVIIGEGPERERLERLIDRHGLGHRVTLAGALKDPELCAYLKAAAIFVLPSITAAETFGIAQLQAMGCGTPVVNTELPTAVPHIASNGAEGLTTPPGDPEALAQALARLLADPKLRARLGAAGRVKVEKIFSVRAFEAAIENVICGLKQKVES